ncbi:hypothetical protein [Metabacillus sediminilitoris]|uniref:Uncharacterized protein n=1 Tax=Metabacillus sediminilitoris TaxID=2567941 RepID=A0A4S4BUY5_9BACI|nr:hypothetical protein [Metabacillus sediminilitoris]QGQ44733.1 hypothetical protein GMB29_05280 [Metabacillus sediminilitoris]THF78919.1 hypothetical protein E6W99_14440 [Metabacillus sediminilitoris]
MGYILPIQHVTYTQYANRTLPVKNQISKVLPSAAVQLQLSNQETREPRQRFADILESKMRKIKSSPSFIEKGKHVNEFV